MRAVHLIIALLFVACEKNTEIDPCDRQRGRFIDGIHYIESDMLDENSKWDYHRWNRYRRKHSEYLPDPRCIPIERTPDRKEQIRESEKVIDLLR